MIEALARQPIDETKGESVAVESAMDNPNLMCVNYSKSVVGDKVETLLLIWATRHRPTPTMVRHLSQYYTGATTRPRGAVLLYHAPEQPLSADEMAVLKELAAAQKQKIWFVERHDASSQLPEIIQGLC